MNVEINTTKNVALYCRLSREDGDSVESSSIKSQKEILSEYAKNNGWNIYETYIDDGFSGGNFNRPGFKRLLDDIESGKIDILLTKDLSRLGRNYIQTGFYTEEYFPEHKVRYIAVNDNYDSTIEDSMDFTPFKNIINQWYLKDISKKVRAVHEMRMKKGILPKGLAIPLYGYKQNQNNERVIEEETAIVVRKIFDMYLNRINTQEIQKYLFDRKIPCPGYYNYLTYNYNAKEWIKADEKKKFTWHKGIITRILGNPEYKGDLVLKRKKTISYKTHKQVRCPLSEQYLFENRFVGLVSEEVFHEVKSLLKSRTRSEVSIDLNRYKGLLYCANCGHVLSYNKVNPNTKNRTLGKTEYKCRYRHCDHHTAIRIEVIDALLDKELTSLINFLISNELKVKKMAEMYKAKTDKTPINLKKEFENLQNRKKKIEVLIQKLFEKNTSGEINDIVFKKMTDSYNKEYLEIDKDLTNLKLKLSKNNNQEKNSFLVINQFYEKLKMCQGKLINRKIIQKLLFKVHLKKENNKVSVHFEFVDIGDLLENYVNGK